MESVDAKLARASEHVKSLEQAVADYTASSEREIILKLNPDETIVSLMTWSKDPYPPIRISAIVGDCLFNTRAALDNLVCGLVRLKTPGDDCGASSFPILTAVAKWKDPSDALRGVEADAKRVIKECQPFNRPPASIEIDPLNILNVLRNRDTHRAALLTSGFSANTEFLIHTNDGRLLHVRSDQPMFGEQWQSIPLSIPPATVRGGARVEAKGRTVIAFRDEGPWGDRSVVDVVNTCLHYVSDDVIRKFTRFFVPRP
jgi:hypothetical protein